MFLSIGGLGNTLDLFPCTNAEALASSAVDQTRMNGWGVRHTAFAVETEDDLRDACFALQAGGGPDPAGDQSRRPEKHLLPRHGGESPGDLLGPAE